MIDMKGMNGGVQDAKPYTFKTQGVLTHGWGYDLYVLHPTIGSNANFSIECLQRSLHKVFAKINKDENLEWPSELHYQACLIHYVVDGCCCCCVYYPRVCDCNIRLIGRWGSRQQKSSSFRIYGVSCSSWYNNNLY